MNSPNCACCSRRSANWAAEPRCIWSTMAIIRCTCRRVRGVTTPMSWLSCLTPPLFGSANGLGLLPGDGVDVSLTYAIPDLHGRFDLLCDALAKIEEHAAGRSGTIVALGDYVNRGPNSREVVQKMRAGVPDGWRVVALKGNHDAMMVEALRDPSKMKQWIEKGGDATIKS